MENTFTITPTSQRISLEPGQVYEGAITIVNPTNSTKDFNYVAEVTPYSVLGEDYSADLINSSDYNMIKDWIEIENPTDTIHPNESRQLKYKITVPDNAPGGGQYATIAISSSDEPDTTESLAVQNIFEIASVIYASVAGETVHEGHIESNIVPEFVISTPVTLSASLSNSGNVHETALFSISVTNIFTGQVILPTEDNNGQHIEYIMPETTRYISNELNNLPALGIVKITQSINYSGQTSNVEKIMVICPIWFVAIVAVTLGIIITAITLLIKKHHKNKIIV